MNIWIINHYALPPIYNGSNRHFSLGKELALLGHQVTIIAANNHHFAEVGKTTGFYPSDFMNNAVEWREEKMKLVFLDTPKYHGNGFGRLWNMICFSLEVLKLRKYGGEDKPNIVIGSSVHLFAVLSAKLVATHFQIPFCFEVRDIWPKSLIDMKAISQWHPLALLLSYLEAYLYKKADAIITLLPSFDKYLTRFKLESKKVIYIPNAIDVISFPSCSLACDDKKSLVVMYLGSHGEANGLSVLIDAAEELEKKPASRKIEWRFIGSGNQKQSLKERVTKTGLTTVVFEDSVPKNDIPRVISEADILVVNLIDVDVYRYGISLNKIFDYLASQRPIVFASNAVNNPILSAQAGITVPSGDVKGIAQAIRDIADLPIEERKAMGERGRKYVETHHNYKTLAAQLDNELKELLI
jgi:glycosyltransferase involved in cell wall biosynthesis